MNTSFRQNAILEARRWIETNPVYLDTETTGLGNKDMVIEIAVVDDQGNELFDSLIRTTKTVDPAARRVHGITDAEIRSAPTWYEVWPMADTVLQGRFIGGYNVDFDLRMLQQTHQVYGSRWTLPAGNFFDIMKLYAQYHGDWDSYHRSFRYQSLEIAGRQCKLQLQNTHRALDDCLLARAVLHYVAENE